MLSNREVKYILSGRYRETVDGKSSWTYTVTVTMVMLILLMITAAVMITCSFISEYAFNISDNITIISHMYSNLTIGGEIIRGDLIDKSYQTIMIIGLIFLVLSLFFMTCLLNNYYGKEKEYIEDNLIAYRKGEIKFED